MFIAYKENDKEQYVSQSGLNPENLPALKIKTADGDKFAFLRTSGNNLSKIKVNINDTSYHLQKMNPVCIAISGSSTFKMFTYLNGELKEVNTTFEGVAEQYQEIKWIQYIPEYGVYVVFLYTAGKSSSSGWKWFFQSTIHSQTVATFIGVSFDGVNFTFYPSALSDQSEPFFIFYNKNAKELEIGCYYQTSARPVVNVDTCRILKFDIFNNILTDSKVQTGISMIKATILKTNKGNIYYANHEGSFAGGAYYFGLYENWKGNREENFQIYYNQSLEKIYLQSDTALYQLPADEIIKEDDLETCGENEFYKSYGNINGYEVYSKTQIYKDFNSKIDLENSLYSLEPPSMNYDFYTKKYILLCADDDNIYVKATLDFKDYETLYSTPKKNVTYGSVSGFVNSYRVEISRQG